jgi:hypothetical protein
MVCLTKPLRNGSPTGLIGMKRQLDADRFSVRIDASSKSGSEGGGILAKLSEVEVVVVIPRIS